MIQILLDEDKQRQCEEIFLKYMAEKLPFYPAEIYGDSSDDNPFLAKEKEKTAKDVEQIKDTRKKLWKGYKLLYQYLYLPGKDSPYPEEQEAETKEVYKDRLRRLLVGRKGEMTAGKRREMLMEIISEIGKIKNDDTLKGIFLYRGFSDSPEARQILSIIGMDVCPYCNRLFTVTVKQDEMKKKENGNGKGVRPELDHYFPRALYPYLAIHLYNLIPACGICNRFKSSHDTYEKPLLYPYDEGMGSEYVFMSYPQNGAMLYLKRFAAQEDFRLRIEPNLRRIYGNDILSVREREQLEERIATSVKVFHLEEVYKAHTDIAAAVLKNRYVFSEEYVEMLQRKFPDVDFTMEDVKRVLYSRDIRMENWGKNVLAKLVHDMDAEIGEKE